MATVKGIYEHYGRRFLITRTSPDSVKIGLDCGDHDHEDYVVGRIEGDRRWGLGRKDSGSFHEGDFLEAVEQCTSELSEECDSLDAIEQVDDFFSTEVTLNLRSRLGIPDKYEITSSAPTIFCTMDADNPGFDVTHHDIVTPLVRPDGEQIRLIVTGTLVHGAEPPDTDYRIHDEGASLGYLRSNGMTDDDELRSSVQRVLSRSEVPVKCEDDGRLTADLADGGGNAIDVSMFADACLAVSRLAG